MYEFTCERYLWEVFGILAKKFEGRKYAREVIAVVKWGTKLTSVVCKGNAIKREKK